MRLFIAIPLSESIRQEIIPLQNRIKQVADSWGADVRWTQPEQMHVTLKFLGECPDKSPHGIGEALKTVARETEDFSIQFGGFGGFPQRGNPRVLWLGLLEGLPEVKALAERVEYALEPYGFKKEDHGFHAHLTLGRVKSIRNSNAFHRWRETEKPPGPGKMMAGKISLIQSVLSPAGPTYTTLKEVTLGSSRRPGGL